MRKTIYKLFWVWDFDKEEDWLNEMASQGLILTGVGVCRYTFEECIPNEYNVRLELLERLPKCQESQDYIKFIEETEAEYLGGIAFWVYFRKKTDNGEFNLYSDNASRIKYLHRVLVLLAIINILLLCAGLSNLAIGTQSSPNFILGILCLGLVIFATRKLMQVRLKNQNLRKSQNLYE